MDERLKTTKSCTLEIQIESSNEPTYINSFKLKWSIVFRLAKIISGKLTCLIQHFEADFQRKVSLKILNSKECQLPNPEFRFNSEKFPR